MVELPETQSKTVAAIYAAYETDRKDPRREHLGASLIGDECHRNLWYVFRWANPHEHEGRILRLFDTGNIEEERIVKDLIRIGVELQFKDPKTGEQWLFSWFGGHFGGSTDGIGTGFPEAPVAIHILEAKSAKSKLFKVLKAKGVKKSNPKHYAQMQAYMKGAREQHGIDVSRAFYMVGCKDTDDIYVDRIHYDEPEAAVLLAKAETVVFSPTPLERVTEDQSSFLCRWCDHKSICHFEQVADLKGNCRTCLSSTPERDGTWSCDLHKVTLSLEDQRSGCQSHLFIPDLLPWEQVDASEGERWVSYRKRDGTVMVDKDCDLREK